MENITEEQIRIATQIYGSIDLAESKEAAFKANKFLLDTDYIANKIIEYQFLNKELDNDYTEILKKREDAREVIRKYESEA